MQTIHRHVSGRHSDSLASQVAEDLLDKIDRGVIKPGEQLPTERELMQQYGVSRTVVREATSSLRASGRIMTRQGRGAFVLSASPRPTFGVEFASPRTVGEVVNAMDIRQGLESEAAAIAARRRDPTDIAAIKTALQALDVALSAGTGFRAVDAEFHMAIARATGNPYFTDFLGKLVQLLAGRTRPERTRSNPLNKDHVDRVRHEHAQIYDAIERGDSEAARSAMLLHIANSRERMRQALETAAIRIPATDIPIA